jgi:non-specific serine/threonine protein kinase
MQIWSAEIKELESLYTSIKGRFPEFEKELEQLIETKDANVVMLYSRRCLEVIITDLCESELKRPRKTEPLKGIIDKLHREEKVPSNIITSMDHLNSLSTYGAHPKEFDPEQVKPVLNNLTTIIKWYLRYKDIEVDKTIQEKEDYPISHSYSQPEKTIIVLPFENISTDPDQDYFSDGLTEEIITDLSQVHDLLVISRSSAMTFKGVRKKIKEIAREVNVRYVLEGSVRKAGNDLRITAQLIDAKKDTHLWAEKYSGTIDDIFNIQEKVSHSIVDALKIKLNPEEQKRISEVPIDNVKAYEYYFRAKQALGAWTEPELKLAEQLLQKGLELAGENTLLYSQLGYINYQYWNLGFNKDGKCLDKAADYVHKIFEIEADSLHGYFLKGTLEMAGGTIKQFIHDYNRVLSGDPNHAEALLWMSFWLGYLGKTSLAIPYYERLMRIDPLSVQVQFLPLWFKMYEGRFEAALEPIQEFYRSNPEFLGNQWLFILVNTYLYRQEEAISGIDKLGKEVPDNHHSRLFSLLKYALLGDKSKLISLDSDLEKWAEKDSSYAYLIAQCLSLVKEIEKALDWLEISINLGGINYPFLNDYDPLFQNVRGEERFKNLMKRVKYEWENFEVDQ